jgi:ribosomal protein S18 acetylase RimI-like enzyme
MTYRKAKSNEAEAIAHLHAQSWQVAYRGILTDAFLDHEVVNNRLKIWQERFTHPAKNEFICVAIEKQALKGFVCVYGNDDAQWGALVDNLHVLPDFQGHGVGKKLMQEAAKWVAKKYPNSGLYLWVYEDNHAARHFYEKMGGKNVESQIYDNADGGSANIFRYAWTDIEKLLV